MATCLLVGVKVTQRHNGTDHGGTDGRTQHLASTSKQFKSRQTLAQLFIAITEADGAIIEVKNDDNPISHLVALWLALGVGVDCTVVIETLVVDNVPAN